MGGHQQVERPPSPDVALMEPSLYLTQAFGDHHLRRSRRNAAWVSAAVLAALIAASLLKVDVYAVGIGHISPDSYLESIDAPRTGKVGEIFVRDGATVKAGEPILSYDCAPQRAQSEAAARQLANLQREMRAQDSVVDRIVRGRTSDGASGTIAPDAALRVSLQNSIVAAGRQAVQRANLRIEGSRARLAAAGSDLALARSRYERAAALSDRDALAHAPPDAASSEIRAYEAKVNLARSELADSGQAAVQANNEVATAILRGQDAALTRQSVLRTQVYELQTEAVKVDKELTDCVVEAPASGKLFWLETRAAGAWLRSATPLAKVVPNNRPMVIAAQLRNQDIPFVHAGQRVIVKLDSLPFQRFGTLHGRVRFVAPDAVSDANGESFYKVEVEITSTPDSVRRELPTLIAGLDVKINVVTDKRRLISYFFDPIILAIKESFHER